MTTEASAAHWIAVLPWLQLSSAVGIGDVRFLPVDATQPQANLPELASVAADCAQVLRTFRVSPKHSITTCTFIVPDGWDPEAPADEAA